MTTGNVVYNGEAAKMVDYFTNLGYPCPHLTNPGDYYSKYYSIKAMLCFL